MQLAHVAVRTDQGVGVELHCEAWPINVHYWLVIRSMCREFCTLVLLILSDSWGNHSVKSKNMNENFYLSPSVPVHYMHSYSRKLAATFIGVLICDML